MKRLINTLLPYYVHTNILTPNLSFKKKADFFFFYLDRYIYSPIFHKLYGNKTENEKNELKKEFTKKLAQKFGVNFGIYSKDSYNDNTSKCNVNKNEEIEVAALWPNQIYHVNPLNVKNEIKDKKFNIVYIGHMSVLVQMQNFNILIDPVLSNRIGLYNILGVKRIIKPGLHLENIPSIDFILLSNNRYDTMDLETLRRIILRDNSIIIGGMNIRRYMLKSKYPVVYPLNWFNKLQFENLAFYYLPTITNSHRYFFDKNVYLPGSFFIHDKLHNTSIFYSGHSAYSNHFKQIKNYIKTIIKNNQIDLSILPIGIYKPRELYAHFHMSPSEALQSHLDLNSKMSLCVGTDVFCLGGEKYKEAINELKNSVSYYEKKENKKVNLITLEPGQNIML
ncbi:conserved Plasmodium protein, unknown function [Plasmodium vinckei]|uniref:Metallo-beta-lactamase domain-containing protein n=1 Tax=Plasmodium vinckei TaxID=5860 RepID=A0A6V7T2X8_PLAVN|nr:conserved Plasmodium protein, unknown function [Plasmodium vinckei]